MQALVTVTEAAPPAVRMQADVADWTAVAATCALLCQLAHPTSFKPLKPLPLLHVCARCAAAGANDTEAQHHAVSDI